jgi:hypothetical protein
VRDQRNTYHIRSCANSKKRVHTSCHLSLVCTLSHYHNYPIAFLGVVVAKVAQGDYAMRFLEGCCLPSPSSGPKTNGPSCYRPSTSLSSGLSRVQASREFRLKNKRIQNFATPMIQNAIVERTRGQSSCFWMQDSPKLTSSTRFGLPELMIFSFYLLSDPTNRQTYQPAEPPFFRPGYLVRGSNRRAGGVEERETRGPR